ncbi:transcription factor iie [Plasmopara halstedii]|uniref:Transcription factor iie n=1 Tax=Plasmopara halstedii TaxID=4781 RepID=A0A0P1APM5_PLAHL|nr:transcription factor iie [Plasmopara halstedii]CEG42978.1 transcription factor iie [Plasmopara halstedii]|eukprot:XP_024579347.1 transcription factor iie [Plasmopara halstedii]
MVGLVEKLVYLVGRAFYSDEHVVVLGALMREKFLKDDDMGNAMNLQTRQVRKIMNELHQDNLVCEEVLNDKRVGGSSSTSYWYIDYKYFVDVVQYRLYLMHEHLKDSEQLEIERQTFQCSDPECGREYTALEAQLLLMPGQFQFRCGHCNELLLECDNNDRLLRIQNLQRKFKDQMNKQKGNHDGIYEVLRRIGDFVKEGHALPNNLPSENRAAGLGGTSTRSTTSGGSGNRGGGANHGSGSNRGDDQNSKSYLYPYGSQDQEIIVDIAGTNQAEDDYLTSRDRKEDKEVASQQVAAPRALPEFLQGSSISGHMAAKHLQSVDSITDDSSISMKTTLKGVHSPSQSDMTEEERQEAFKRAYMAELERYNEDKYEGEVQIQVDKQGWDAEMNDDAMDEEELEDVEWEWYTDDEGRTTDAEVTVNGQPKRLDGVDDEDLLNMTEQEFLSCYRMCLANKDASL